MNNRVVLQVPMEASLRKLAEESALEQGFSSLQEYVRVILKQAADKLFIMRLDRSSKEVQISPKAAKRYDKMMKEIRSGKAKTIGFDNVDEMMKYLNS